jgi:hypothetical protein
MKMRLVRMPGDQKEEEPKSTPRLLQSRQKTVFSDTAAKVCGCCYHNGDGDETVMLPQKTATPE